MASRQADEVLHGLRQMAETQTALLTDGQLLNRFTVDRDDEAFSVLVRRHGNLVYGVCRNILRHEHDAEDAFQATFLVLARRADAIREEKAIASWLYRVAYRVATKARVASERRRRREDQAVRVPEDRPAGELAWRELQAMLDEELNRLPSKYRTPFVLCCLTGKSKAEAAVELGWKEGTVSSRLAKARTLLQTRLARRGVTLSAVLSGLAISQPGASALVPGPLLEATQRAGPMFAANPRMPAGMASAPATLARTVLQGMAIGRLKVGMTLVAVLALVGTTAVVALEAPSEPEETVREQVIAAAPDETGSSIPGPRMMIDGSVVGPDGTPVPGAQVLVTVSQRMQLKYVDFAARFAQNILGTAEADSQGEFRLFVPQTTNKHNGLTTIAVAPGYAFSSYRPNSPDITATEHRFPLRLVRGQPARARVVDQARQPVAGVTVHLLGMERIGTPSFLALYYESPVPIPNWPGPFVTDREGYFTIPDVVPGTKLSCQVRDDRFARDWLIFQSTGDVSARPPDLQVMPGRIIDGQVIREDSGLPLAEATIVVTSNMPALQGIVQSRTDAQGRFRIRPFLADRHTLQVYPPDGQPYPVVWRDFNWQKATDQMRIDLTIPRGNLVRGTVREEVSGKPVAGAEITYDYAELLHPRVGRTGIQLRTNESRTRADGSFALAVPAGPGHLLVKAADPDFIHTEITSGQMEDRKASGTPYFPDAFVAFHLRPTDPFPEVGISLRRGITRRARIVGPDGQPARSALVYCSTYIPNGLEVAGDNVPVRNGRFAIPGCNPDEKSKVWVYDPEKKCGAVAELDGTGDQESEIRLARCVPARVRFVDPAGLPIPKPSMTNFQLVVRPGDDVNTSREKGTPAAITISAYRIYGRSFRPTETGGGYLELPDLIPGANYFLQARAGNDWSGPVTFTAPQTGTADIGNIVVRPLR